MVFARGPRAMQHSSTRSSSSTSTTNYQYLYKIAAHVIDFMPEAVPGICLFDFDVTSSSPTISADLHSITQDEPKNLIWNEFCSGISCCDTCDYNNRLLSMSPYLFCRRLVLIILQLHHNDQFTILSFPGAIVLFAKNGKNY